LEIVFRSKGGAPIPSSTPQELAKNSALEKAAMFKKGNDAQHGETGLRTRRRQSTPKSPRGISSTETQTTVEAEQPANLRGRLAKVGEQPDHQEPSRTQIHGSSSFDESQNTDMVIIESDSDADIGSPEMDEDEAFFEALRRSKEEQHSRGTNLQEQDLAIQAVLLTINGTAKDPMAEALQASNATYKEECARNEERSLSYDLAVKMSKSMVSHAIPRPRAVASQALSSGGDGKPEPPQKRICVGEEHLNEKFNTFCETLITMGFDDIPSLRLAYKNSDGNIELAVAMMVSKFG